MDFLTPQETSTGELLFELALEGARVQAEDRLGRDTLEGGAMVDRLYPSALVAVCAMQVGVSERALEITAGYVTERNPETGLERVRPTRTGGKLTCDA